MPEFLAKDVLAEGIFETLRSEKRKIVALGEHLDRLFDSARTLDFSIGRSRVQLKRLLEKEISSKPYPNALIRLAFLKEGKRARLFLIVKEAKRYPLSYYERGVAVRTSATRRNVISALDAQLKVKDYTNGLLATIDSLTLPEALEEIYLDARGYVTEGRIANLFMVKGGELWTPPSSLGILRGITRDQTLRRSRELRIPVREEPFTRTQLYGADEAFLTNTSMGIMPVASVDRRVIGNGKVGPITKKLGLSWQKQNRPS